MNEQTNWDQSLVKKYNSSNHYKLLNQLRNEVKKYPLNNKKKNSSNLIKDTNQDNKNNSTVSYTQNTSFSNDSKQSNELNSNKSSVSFNNSKNFSIYNQTNLISRQNEVSVSAKSISNEDSSSPTFKERLNQIDMK